MDSKQLKDFLDAQVDRFNRPEFIVSDPISIPHLFSKKQDREISGLWTAILSWGQRVTIINKAKELMALMDYAPHQFIMQHEEKDRQAFLHFKHRTFQAPDTLHFLSFFQNYYSKHESLEDAFISPSANDANNLEEGLKNFRGVFFEDHGHLKRTRKHISSPARGSACKRLNMFLRWMVRKDNKGVDFGIWDKITPENLKIPLDLHVFRVASRLGLLHSKNANWKAVVELTERLKEFDRSDPVKYDYALFGLGILQFDKSGI